jgi:hypothetical protein
MVWLDLGTWDTFPAYLVVARGGGQTDVGLVGAGHLPWLPAAALLLRSLQQAGDYLGQHGVGDHDIKAHIYVFLF